MMDVSLSLDLSTRMVHDARPLWIEAGRLESAILSSKLRKISIDRPIYVTGLARAGSTLILEYLAAHDQVATHQYRDFPFIFTPYFSRTFTDLFGKKTEAKERAHGDRMMVSPQSPEAMEEMLWMAFSEHDDAFASFYVSHIKKLLLATHASRYAAKNNNLFHRLPKIFAMFPDARIIIPVRDPVSHIGSLVRQHRRFLKEASHPRAVRHLLAQGHTEFGPTRHAYSDNDIDSWAHQWNQTYGTLASYIGHAQCMFVPFESLCEKPHAWLEAMSRHAKLETPHTVDVFAKGIATPNYYQHGLSNADIARIRDLTAEISTKFTKIAL